MWNTCQRIVHIDVRRRSPRRWFFFRTSAFCFTVCSCGSNCPPLSRHLVVFHFSLNWNIIFVSILLGVHTCKHFNHHEHIHSYFLNLNCSLLQTGCVIQRHGAGQSIHSRVFFNLSFLLRDKMKRVHILMLYIGAYLAWAKYRCTIFVLVPPCFPGLQKIFSLGC